MVRVAVFCLASAAGALSGCAPGRGDLDRLWPGFDRSVWIISDGAGEEIVPLSEGSLRLQERDAIEAVYAAGAIEVLERSQFDADGRGWRRRLEVNGLRSGFDLALVVPVRTADGKALAISVNGAPLFADPDADDVVVQLSRDGATEISVRERR